jgi:hypothetical protein
MMRIQLGRSWGMMAADAMQNVYFVNGRPSVANSVVATRLRASGIAWEPEFTWEEITEKGKPPVKRCTGCTLWLTRYDREQRRYMPMLDRKSAQVNVSYTASDAASAMVYADGGMKPLLSKQTYQSFPDFMFYWRCIGRVWRFYAPDVMRGAVTFEERYDVIEGDVPPEQQPKPLAIDATGDKPAKSMRDVIMHQEPLIDTKAEDKSK